MTDTAEIATAQPLTPLKGFLVLLAVIVAVAGYVLFVRLFGVEASYAGFLFLLYWGAIENGRVDTLPAIALGALFGLLIAFLMQYLPAHYGPVGYVLPLTLITVAVYFQIMGWAKWIVNAPAMLFLSVGAIPLIQEHADFGDMTLAVLLAILFFGGPAMLVSRIAKRRSAADPAVV